jgi:hypothetical protein
VLQASRIDGTSIESQQHTGGEPATHTRGSTTANWPRTHTAALAHADGRHKRPEKGAAADRGACNTSINAYGHPSINTQLAILHRNALRGSTPAMRYRRHNLAPAATSQPVEGTQRRIHFCAANPPATPPGRVAPVAGVCSTGVCGGSSVGMGGGGTEEARGARERGPGVGEGPVWDGTGDGPACEDANNRATEDGHRHRHRYKARTQQTHARTHKHAESRQRSGHMMSPPAARSAYEQHRDGLPPPLPSPYQHDTPRAKHRECTTRVLGQVLGQVLSRTHQSNCECICPKPWYTPGTTPWR